jgi:hypothetical protein
MRVLAASLFAALALFGVDISAVEVPVEYFQPNFKDPYAGFPDALLDIDIQIPDGCQSTLTVQVNIPVNSGDESNAIFQGAAFPFRTITGISTHNSIQNPAVASVAWDGVSVLTFSNFQATATGPSTQGPSWLNFNFEIPEAKFNDPTVQNFVDDPTRVPLKLVFDADYVGNLNKFINLSLRSHFSATTNVPERCGNAGGHGDPVFAGFQGQEFQFHGLPDEHFNLVSSPDVQLNSHFVYLSSGKCDYNDTECFTHPGTYMDVLGLSVGESHVKMVAGTHEAGMRVWVNDMEIKRGAHINRLASNVTGSLRYHHNGKVDINTDVMGLQIVNSDMFFNIRAALKDEQLLRVGSTKHTVTDKAVCKTNSETHNHQLVESTVAKKYPVTTPLHGLIGQTWRNVLVCGRNWMGTVQDYLVSDLFASDNHYNYFKW